MIRATVEDSNPPCGASSGWWVNLPRRLGAVHEFTGTQAARRNAGSGHEQAAGAGLGLLLWRVGQLLVIHTPWVAISVVNSVAPTVSTAQHSGSCLSPGPDNLR